MEHVPVTLQRIVYLWLTLLICCYTMLGYEIYSIWHWPYFADRTNAYLWVLGRLACIIALHLWAEKQLDEPPRINKP
jgi:hypothetical protein